MGCIPDIGISVSERETGNLFYFLLGGVVVGTIVGLYFTTRKKGEDDFDE